PPTVLIFRDGHREEVADYAIVGCVIYAHRARASGDDDQNGYGLNNIQVSALDVPATVRMNRENGVSFVLPDGPNQVLTRPYNRAYLEIPLTSRLTLMSRAEVITR